MTWQIMISSHYAIYFLDKKDAAMSLIIIRYVAMKRYLRNIRYNISVGRLHKSTCFCTNLVQFASNGTQVNLKQMIYCDCKGFHVRVKSAVIVYLSLICNEEMNFSRLLLVLDFHVFHLFHEKTERYR